MSIAVRNSMHLVLYRCCCKGRYSINIQLKSRGKSRNMIMTGDWSPCGKPYATNQPTSCAQSRAHQTKTCDFKVVSEKNKALCSVLQATILTSLAFCHPRLDYPRTLANTGLHLLQAYFSISLSATRNQQQ